MNGSGRHSDGAVSSVNMVLVRGSCLMFVMWLLQGDGKRWEELQGRAFVLYDGSSMIPIGRFAREVPAAVPRLVDVRVPDVRSQGAKLRSERGEQTSSQVWLCSAFHNTLRTSVMRVPHHEALNRRHAFVPFYFLNA